MKYHEANQKAEVLNSVYGKETYYVEKIGNIKYNVVENS